MATNISPKPMPKRVAIVVVLVVLTISTRIESQEYPKRAVIAIEYFGDLDKPIFPIVISDSKSEAEHYRDALIKIGKWYKLDLRYLFTVRRRLLGRLITAIESQEDGVQLGPEEKPERYRYNSVVLTIVMQQRRKTLVFHVEPAMSLLDQLQTLCKDDNALREELKHFQEQVRLWGSYQRSNESK